MKNNPRFGAVGIALVIAAVGLVGFIGWRLYDANKTQQNDSADQASSDQAQTNTSDDSQADTATYLDIKELGVRIKLSDSIKDAVYYYDTSNKYPLVRVSTQALIDKSNGACDPKVSSPFGGLYKTQDVSQPDGSVLKANGSSVFQFGSDYIVYSTPTRACSAYAEATSLETSQLASFKEALKTMQLNQ